MSLRCFGIRSTACRPIGLGRKEDEEEAQLRELKEREDCLVTSCHFIVQYWSIMRYHEQPGHFAFERLER